jgi:ribosomal protein S20
MIAMERLLKHKLLVGLAAVLVMAGGGAAYAATQTQTNPRQALLNDVAKRLNVSPSQLRSAFQGALLDRLNAAVKAGRITQAQADRLKQRIEQGALPLGGFGHRGFWREGRGPGGRFGPAGPGGQLGLAGTLFGPFDAAAKYLGLSRGQLLSELRGGKTLAQIAQAQGKSVSGLEQALVSAQTARLDRAVAKGELTKGEEQRRLSRLSRRVARLVEHGRVAGPLPAGPPPLFGGPAAIAPGPPPGGPPAPGA